LLGQPQRVARVLGFEGGQFELGFGALLRVARLVFAAFGGVEGARVFHTPGALGHGDNAEIGSMPAATADCLNDFINVVRNFRNQNHVCAAGNARAERQPARAMPHDFGDNNAMMAMRRTVQTVNGFRRNVQRGSETEGGIRQRHVVVNGLGQRDDVESGFGQPQAALLRAAAAKTHQRVEAVFFIVLNDDFGHVARAAVNLHPVRFVAARA